MTEQNIREEIDEKLPLIVEHAASFPAPTPEKKDGEDSPK